MHRLIEFIKRIYVVVLFILLEGIALWQYAASTPYTEAKILSRTTWFGGLVSGAVSDVVHFFSLPDENRVLAARVAELEQTLDREREMRGGGALSVEQVEAMGFDYLRYRYYSANVVSMTTNRQRNYVVVDKGEADGIVNNMGVMTPDRKLVGYVVSCSENYSVVMPMLNTEFGIGGRLVDNNYACSIRWSGRSSHYVEAIDLSTYANPQVGMSVEVSSERLPEGVLIGTIESYELNVVSTAYSAKLRIAADLAALDNVLLVENVHYGEIEELLESVQRN